MSVALPNGVTLALATAYAASINISGITNASPAVVTTSAVHGLATGNIIEITTGWSNLNNKLARVTVLTTTTFSIDNFDCTSLTQYPIGSSAGSMRQVTTWQNISQVTDLTSNGGAMQYVNYSFLEQSFETQMPTQFAPQSLTMKIADDNTLPGYIAIKAASTARALTALRATLPSGSSLYYNGFFDFDETPSMTKNQLMVVSSGFSLQARPTRY